LKNLPINFLLALIVEKTHFNIDTWKIEPWQKDENRAQSASITMTNDP